MEVVEDEEVGFQNEVWAGYERVAAKTSFRLRRPVVPRGNSELIEQWRDDLPERGRYPGKARECDLGMGKIADYPVEDIERELLKIPRFREGDVGSTGLMDGTASTESGRSRVVCRVY